MKILRKKQSPVQQLPRLISPAELAAISGGVPSNCVSDGSGGLWCVVGPVTRRGVAAK